MDLPSIDIWTNLLENVPFASPLKWYAEKWAIISYQHRLSIDICIFKRPFTPSSEWIQSVSSINLLIYSTQQHITHEKLIAVNSSQWQTPWRLLPFRQRIISTDFHISNIIIIIQENHDKRQHLSTKLV